MGSFLFSLVAGSGLTWVFMELRRDGYWRKFNTRRTETTELARLMRERQPAMDRYKEWKDQKAKRERQDVDELAAQLTEDGKYLLESGYANASTKTRNMGIRVIQAATLLARSPTPHEP